MASQITQQYKESLSELDNIAKDIEEMKMVLIKQWSNSTSSNKKNAQE